jgi:transposase-like protein
MPKVEWTDEDRATAYVQWIANEKNVRRTAEDVGIPMVLLRYWVKEWEENGPPPRQ